MLRDAQGRARIVFSVLGSDPIIALQDEHEALRAMLAVAGGKPALKLFDEHGKGPMAIEVASNGSMLTMQDENEKNRLLLSVVVPKPRGPSASQVVLADEQGNGTLTLLAPDASAGQPGFIVREGKGKNAVALGPSFVSLRGEDGKQRGLLTLLNDNPLLIFHDVLEQPRLTLGAAPVPNGTKWSLIITGGDGKFYWGPRKPTRASS